MTDGKTKVWYTLKDVFEVLHNRGISLTWAQLKVYQEAKLVPPFKNIVLFRKEKEMPIFIQEDIDTLVEVIAKINRNKNRNY